MERETLQITENVRQVSWAMRIQCSQCHTILSTGGRQRLLRLEAFFTRSGASRRTIPRETVIYNSKGVRQSNPVTGAVGEPKFLAERSLISSPVTTGPCVLAKMGWPPRRPLLCPQSANMTWAHFFGVGIIDPVVTCGSANPHPFELLDALGKKLTEYNY